jgi:putative hydrolase of the HAD superfamily
MSDLSPIRAVLFDLDGTLYHQLPLRAFMALELAVLPIRRRSVSAASEELRGISAFRRVREELREVPHDLPLERLQYERAAERVGVDAARMEKWVLEWIHRRPLRHLARCRRRGLGALLDALDERGLRAGIFSDHPVAAKLEALGVAGRFDPLLCATDPEIDAFKPDPRGFLRACRIWDLEPREVLYVGDRHEVDAIGAARAGMACALIGRSSTLTPRGEGPAIAGGPIAVSSLSELLDGIDRAGP